MSNEYDPRSNEDSAFWGIELPPELRTGFLDDVNPLDELLRTELNEADYNFAKLYECAARLGMIASYFTVHSYGTQEGAVSVASLQVVESDAYRKDDCLQLVINARTNEHFAPERGMYIAIEDYFLDFDRRLLTVQKGFVSIRDEFQLPNKTPCVIWQNAEGLKRIFWGEGYALLHPDYETPLDISQAQTLRITSGKLHRLVSRLTEATLDYKE
jgi:hypothetical protein